MKRVVAWQMLALPYTEWGPGTPPGFFPLLDHLFCQAMACQPLPSTWPRQLRCRRCQLLQ